MLILLTKLIIYSTTFTIPVTQMYNIKYDLNFINILYEPIVEF